MQSRRSTRRSALVLARTKLADQDLILTMIAPEGDQFRAVAKGARKPGSRLSARTELFCEVNLLVSEGRGLAIITEAQLVDAHASLRSDLDRVAAASAICEVARLTCYEDVTDPFLYPVLSRALRAVCEADKTELLDLVVAAYVFKVLSHGGWRPVLDSCVACGEPSGSRLSVAAGGLLCDSCAREVAGAHAIDHNMVLWLEALIGWTFDELVAASIDAQTADSLLRYAHEWAATHLDARLRALEFFIGL
ncbi:MAG: DNA repair protein RecO [Coriobacteriales bacterium]|nr:DNA repair protein RecO [Coriobacteriales bacterium]